MTLALAWIVSTWLIGALAEVMRPGFVLAAFRFLLGRLL